MAESALTRSDLDKDLLVNGNPISGRETLVPERLDRGEADGLIVSDNYVETMSGFSFDRRTGEVKIDGKPLKGYVADLVAAAYEENPPPEPEVHVHWKGEWEEDVDYEVDDTVKVTTYDGGTNVGTYFCAEAHTSSVSNAPSGQVNHAPYWYVIHYEFGPT